MSVRNVVKQIHVRITLKKIWWNINLSVVGWKFILKNVLPPPYIV